MKARNTFFSRMDPNQLAVCLEADSLGYSPTIWQLVRHLYYADGAERDYGEAFRWLNTLVRSDACPPRAFLLLGECYYNGYGTVVDYVAAVRTLLRSMEYSGLDKWGMAKSKIYRCECSWWKTARGVLGPSDIRRTRFLLGECYYYGKGVVKDYCKALKYLTLSVQEDEYLYPNKDAELLIGESYYYHRGTKQNTPAGIRWITLASEHGSAEARAFLHKRTMNNVKPG